MEATIKGRRMQQIDPDLVNMGAAVGGAITGQVLRTKPAPWKIVIGCATASSMAGIFLGPMISVLIGVTNLTVQAGINYLVGLIGLIICARVITWAEGQTFIGMLSFIASLSSRQLPPKPPTKEETDHLLNQDSPIEPPFQAR